MAALVKRYFSAEIHSWTPFPGAKEMLQQVHDLGLKLGVLSNARSDWAVKEIMKRLGLTGFFEEILTSATIGIRKPRPEPFKKMLELLELKASDTVMIGNSMEADVAGAKPLGLKMIRLVLSDSTDEIPMKHAVTIEPDFTVSAVYDIVAAIKKAAAS
jgi:putative hydrolase of the HAD superfamily